MPNKLTTLVSELTNVGKVTAGKLKKLGIETIEDLIFYYPFRWEDYRKITQIAQLQPDMPTTIKGVVQLVQGRRSYYKKKSFTEALIADESGTVKIVWFNQPYLTKQLKVGDVIFVSGKPKIDSYGLHFDNPTYEKNPISPIHTARIVPIYPLTGNVTQKQLRFLIKQSLGYVHLIKDWLPKSLKNEFNLSDLHEAVAELHFPSNEKKLEQSQKRLKFDELFAFELQVIKSKRALLSSHATIVKFQELDIKNFVKNLQFKLTDDQKKVSWQIIQDIQKEKPMNRLLEGDVGSGKTVVAAMVLLNTALNGFQASLMAPTEILALQHFQTLTFLLKDFKKIRLCLVTHNNYYLGSEKTDKKTVLDAIIDGRADIVIGTHALIQEHIKFKNLTLAVVDEQHRFGVTQRKNLIKKISDGTTPHLLSMTATPIPRTLALALYGDLDISILKQMPIGRKKIITKVITEKQRNEMYNFVKREIVQGRQAFLICPLIDPSDKLGVKSVTQEYELVSKKEFAKMHVAMMHGKMKPDEKEFIMKDFASGKIDVLVSTSVVEVGVNVPNATVMIIEGAERFGLAQLHQFRGRVGRSEKQSYCFVCTTAVKNISERLKVFSDTEDGFALADYDLQNRGPGEIFGVHQAGWPEFKIAQLHDIPLMQMAKQAAEKILSNEEYIKKYPLLKEKMSMMEEFHRE